MRKTHAAARGVAFLLLAFAIVAAPNSAAAKKDESPASNGYSGMVGIGSALGTLIYAPLKLSYALTGTVLGGLTWVVTGGRSDVATPIVRHAIRGDYVISPSHLEGERSLKFRGDDR